VTPTQSSRTRDDDNMIKLARRPRSDVGYPPRALKISSLEAFPPTLPPIRRPLSYYYYYYNHYNKPTPMSDVCRGGGV